MRRLIYLCLACVLVLSSCAYEIPTAYYFEGDITEPLMLYPDSYYSPIKGIIEPTTQAPPTEEPAAAETTQGEETTEPAEPSMPLFNVDLPSISQLIEGYGEGVAVYYKNLDANMTYTFNSETEFWGASVMKAPYALFLFNQADKGVLDLDEKLTYEEINFYEGTGKIKDMEFGAEFTIRELISYSIIHSDNIAFDMLLKHMELGKYIAFMREIGMPHIQQIRDVRNSRIDAECIGVYINAINDYISSSARHARELKNMLSNVYSKFILSSYPIAHKNGWADKAFHDMAIVYNPHPYLLVILSDRSEGDRDMFADISMAFEGFTNKYTDIIVSQIVANNYAIPSVFDFGE